MAFLIPSLKPYYNNSEEKVILLDFECSFLSFDETGNVQSAALLNSSLLNRSKSLNKFGSLTGWDALLAGQGAAGPNQNSQTGSRGLLGMIDDDQKVQKYKF